MRPVLAVVTGGLLGLACSFDSSPLQEEQPDVGVAPAVFPEDAGAFSPDLRVPGGDPDGQGASLGVDCGEATAAGARYRLIPTGTIVSPVADPTGITHDGEAYWLISGGHNSFVHTLVRLDGTNGEVSRTFTLENLIEQLGTGVYGITWDGQAIWISVSGNTNKLVRVDPATGTILRTASSPTVLGPSDLDFDGIGLWLSTGTGEIYLLDPVTAKIMRSFLTGSLSMGRDTGIAVRNGELWVGGLFGGMAIYDAASGALLGTAVRPHGRGLSPEQVGPSCFVGGELVIADPRTISTYAIASP